MKKPTSKLASMFRRGLGSTPPSCSANKFLEQLDQLAEASQKPKLISTSSTNEQNRNQGAEFEQHLSKIAGWTLAPGSGCGLLFKGDYLDDHWHLEAKSTRNSELGFDTHWWWKSVKQASDKQKEHLAVIFGWDAIPADYTGLNRIFVAVQTPEPELTEELAVARRVYKIPKQQLADMTVNSELNLAITAKYGEHTKVAHLTFITLEAFLRLKETIDADFCD